MKRNMVGLLVSSVAIMVTTEAIAQSSTITFMRVAREDSATDLSHGQWDTAFSSATAVLGDNDGAGSDANCGLTLARSGDRWWFGTSATTDNLLDQDDYENTVSYNWANAYIVQVTTIGWCDGTAAMNVVGCGWPAGWFLPYTMETAAITSNIRGELLVHEYGHTLSLLHGSRPGTDIMEGTINSGDNKASSSDCWWFKYSGWDDSCPTDQGSAPVICDVSPSSLMASGDIAGNGGPPPQAQRRPVSQERAEQDFAGVPITALVDRVYESNPAEVEDFYGADDVATLRAMLPGAKEPGRRRNILGLIGLISDGRQSDLDALVAESENKTGDVFGATVALGMLTARTGNTQALDYLLSRFGKSEGFEKRVVGVGLGVTGAARALRALEADSVERRPGRRRFAAAAEENRRIASLGFRRAMRTPIEFTPRSPSELVQNGVGGTTKD